jgi:FAD/FMN-containing dehydrogenase/Fe-S oxidoreductase
MLAAMDASRRLPDPDRRALAAAAELAGRVAGTVETGALTRWLYSTDASIYRIVPDAVLIAREVDDLVVAAAVAAEFEVPLCVRGAATSLAGQTLGHGIAIDCFHLDRIVEIDHRRRTARVEPGVIQGTLNRAAAAHGLEFGPDTSTVEQATIAGMVGNNSSGSRSIVYGETVDKVRRVGGVLVGGQRLAFGPSDGVHLASGLEGAASGRIGAELDAMRARSRACITLGFPQTRRRVSGYDLLELCEPQPNLAKLLVGSEGTLALFTEIEIELDERPQSRLVAALTFSSLRRALDANLAILETRPSAVELLDLIPLRGSPNLRRFGRLAPVLEGDDRAVLLVEYQGTEDEARAGLRRLDALAAELDHGARLTFTDAESVAEAWELRRAALPLLMGAPGAERPASFVEDTAVALEKLADFVDDFERLCAERKVRASFTGHASAGCMHIRPLLDLKSAQGVADLEGIALAVGRLVKEYRGSLSGEHGDGFSRSWFNPELFGPDVYAELVALKDIFDPQRLLSPGRVVEGPPIAANLRFGSSYRDRSEWTPRLDYEAEGGLDLAVERCFGAGLCKKTVGGMCPPAMVDRDEWLTTRARANALQAIVAGAVPLSAVGDREFEQILGTCLACKACKSECPAAVDVAALKAEWLAEVGARAGVSPLARAIGDFRRLSRLATPIAPLVNALSGTWAARAVMRRAGVAAARPAPRFAARRFSRRAPHVADPEVVVFADCFIEHQEPQIGDALLALLAAAGVRAAAVDAGCCGRTMLSVGRIDQARRAARGAATALAVHARAGRTIAFIEPSCLAMVLDDWQRLLPGDPDMGAVRAAARPALGLVADAAEAGALRFAAGGRALLHPHCHEKAVFGSIDSERALGALPELDLTILDAGCCGMSGVFGYQAEHYELSVAIAERALLPAIRSAGGEVAVLATGTSCRSQIGDLAARRARHPLEFLAGRLL